MDATTILIYIALAALVLLMLIVGVSVVILQRAMQPELSETEVRLRKISQESKQSKTNQQIKSWIDAVINQDQSKNLSPIQRMVVYWPDRWGLREPYLQTGLQLPFEKFVLYFMAYPILVCLVLLLLTQFPLFFVGMWGVPLGAVGLILWRKRKRIKRIQEQLPDSLNMMTSALRAGHSFQSCITLLADEVMPPIGEEFQSMSNDLSLGLPVKDSMMKLTEHVNVPDIRMFSTAILIQRESGGNLAEILDSLSHTIRERFKLQRQISVLTSQARISAYIMGCAPVMLFLIMFVFFNSYIEPLYTTPFGLAGMGVALLGQLAGGFIMYKIVSIRI